jgi:hypothetical protein
MEWVKLKPLDRMSLLWKNLFFIFVKRCSPWWDLSRIMRKPQKTFLFCKSWAEISTIEISGRAKLSSEMNLIDSEIVFYYVWSYRRECRYIEMRFSLWDRRHFGAYIYTRFITLMRSLRQIFEPCPYSSTGWPKYFLLSP